MDWHSPFRLMHAHVQFILDNMTIYLNVATFLYYGLGSCTNGSNQEVRSHDQHVTPVPSVSDYSGNDFVKVIDVFTAFLYAHCVPKLTNS